MRILVLSHTRCGSTVLCKWMSKELGIDLNETPYDKKTFDLIFDQSDVIRKIVAEEYIPTEDIINKFDKVVCLSRENSMDSAISFISARNSELWHTEYEVENDWIESNRDIIIESMYRYDHLKDRYLKNKNTFQITYENIFINKEDINRLIGYLGIENPCHLEMLNYDNRYRKDMNTLKYDSKGRNII